MNGGVFKGPLLARRKYWFYLLLLSSLLLIYLSLRVMMAAFWASQLDTFLQDWEDKRVEPSSAAWTIAYNAANKTIGLYPGSNANYYDRLGRVWEWKQFQHASGDKRASESRQHALEAYRESVATRPLWPYTWLSLAYTKTRLLEIDEEFYDALHRSIALGPWRIKTNRWVADMGLLTWHELDSPTQDLVLESIRRTVNYSKGEASWLEKRATELNRQSVFCAALDLTIKNKRNICVD